MTNRSYDLKFQKNFSDNAFLDRIGMVLKFKKIPESLKDIYLEFTPIDYAADATVKIANNFSSNKILHIYNNNHIYLENFIEILNNDLNIKVDLINDEEFSMYVKNEIENNNVSKVLVTDLDKDYKLNYKSSVNVKCENTIKYLKSINFKWPDITSDYIVSYINYFKNIGYMK